MDNTISEPPYFGHRPEDFPTREQQLHFIRAYLSKFPADDGSSNGICSGKEEEGILKEVLRQEILSDTSESMINNRLYLKKMK